MGDCPIFNVLDAARAVRAEAKRLSDSMPEAFAPSGLKVEQTISEEVGGNPAAQYGVHYRVANPSSRRRRPQQFLLMFDLCRKVGSSDWAHARTALLTFAYHPDYDEGWTTADVVIAGDGRPSSGDMRESCRLHPSGRLVEWDRKDAPWHRRSWFFSLPLIEIRDHDAFSQEIVAPVAELLRNDDTSPAQLFGSTKAVRFSEW